MEISITRRPSSVHERLPETSSTVEPHGDVHVRDTEAVLAVLEQRAIHITDGLQQAVEEADSEFGRPHTPTTNELMSHVHKWTC